MRDNTALGSQGSRLPLHRLLEPAICYARNGVAVTDSQAALTEAKSPQMEGVSGYAETFCPAGRPPRCWPTRASPTPCKRLAAAGHQVERVPAFNDMMGHAGAIARHPDGLLEGAADPRSDSIVAAH